MFDRLRFDEGTRKLIFILCLPLVDGVFATLLVTGALNTFSNILSIALTVFSGAGALTVLYSYSDSVEDARRMVLNSLPVLLIGALAVSLVAPVFEHIIYVQRMQYAAGLALAAIALQMADIPYSDSLSAPAILVTGFLLSVRSLGSVALSTEYVAPTFFTVSAAGGALLAGCSLQNYDMNTAMLRNGSALVLGVIAVSMFGIELPSELGLAIFSVSLIASFR